MNDLWPILSHWGEILLQLLIAVICGGIIGYQRELLDRPAGFRTHVLVCVGSAVYMLVSVAVGGTQYDPARIAAQVTTGIGFLGAGTIIKQGSFVRGLTTAASLWAVAGIGLAAGYGDGTMAIALLGTLVVFLSLTLLKNLERYMERGRWCRLVVSVEHPQEFLKALRPMMETHGIEIFSTGIQSLQDHIGEVVVEGRTPSHSDMEHAVDELYAAPGIRSVRWECR